MQLITFSWQSNRGDQLFARAWQPEGAVRAVIGLIHGIGEHAGRYQHAAEAFNQAGYAVLSFDLPGHGQSGGARGYTSYDDVSGEIDTLLAEAARRYPGLPRFLYGHSLGGSLVLHYVLRRRPPLKGAIVTSPGLAYEGSIPGWKYTAARLLAKVLPSIALSNGLDQGGLSRDPEVARIYQADPLVHDRASAWLGYDLLFKGEQLIAQAKDFPIPLLLMVGSADRLVSPRGVERFASAAPAEKVTFRVWEGFYHELQNEPEKEQVLQAMVNWLDGCL